MPLTNRPWEVDACRVSQLPIHAVKQVDLGAGYAAHFALIGARILLTAPVGEAGQRGIPNFWAARADYLREHGLDTSRHVEVKDYALITSTPSRTGQSQFVTAMKEEFARGKLLALIGFGMSTIVRWIFTANQAMHPGQPGVIALADYTEAIRRALDVLQQAGVDPSTGPDFMSRQPHRQ